jgi:hypothetical protein
MKLYPAIEAILELIPAEGFEQARRSVLSVKNTAAYRPPELHAASWHDLASALGTHLPAPNDEQHWTREIAKIIAEAELD